MAIWLPTRAYTAAAGTTGRRSPACATGGDALEIVGTIKKLPRDAQHAFIIGLSGCTQ
ncbi:MAG TPA: hypothetical protein VMU42_05140 [Candidatus Sulfotelmatobacter sp.]|nr:hypothetical protein [Candidatus Sulfotelmatobacter sp.]